MTQLGGLAQRFESAKVLFSLKGDEIRPSLFEIFKKRFALFLHGDRDGVSLNFLQKSTNGIFNSIEQLVKFEKELPTDILEYLKAANELFEQTTQHQKSITSLRWNAELQLFSLLYSFIRSSKAKTVVETGVANGFTTNAVMRALEENNNFGTLYSFDVLPETQSAYTGSGNWNFNLLNVRKAHKQLVEVVSKLPKVDLWIHDSNHGFRWQKFEYLLALERLNQGGILVSDDIDASPAWCELAKTHFRKSYIIFDSRKFIGIAFK